MSETLEDDQYEYEYDENAQETFLVDIDLTSLNGVPKAQRHGFRKNPHQPISTSGASSKRNLDPEDDEEVDDDAGEPAATSPNPLQVAEPIVGNDIQILDLHTRNPLVCFQNHIYSCTWSDMLGTNLLFSRHERRPIFEPQAASDQYDLLGTSRLKLVGHRSKVIQKPGTKKRGRPLNDTGYGDEMDFTDNDAEAEQPGKSLGNLRFNNTKANINIKRQARFLEEFMDAKRAKGDTDIVRTLLTKQTVHASNKVGQGKSESSGRAALNREVEALNRRVVRGDSAALVRLQEIYSLLEDDEDGDEGVEPSPGP